MILAGCNQLVVRLVMRHHQPYCFDVIASEAPIATRVEIAQRHLLLQPKLDERRAARNLACDEILAVPGD